MKNLFNANGINTTVSGFKKGLTAVVLLAGFVGLSTAAKAQSAVTEKVIVSTPTSVDANGEVIKTNAEFPGGIENFYTYISANLRPDTTCSPGKKVMVLFMIDKDGKVTHAKIKGHELSDKMNAQLVKVFENAPQWIPAKQDGKEVKTHFICPVSFMPKADMMAVNAAPKHN